MKRVLLLVILLSLIGIIGCAPKANRYGIIFISTGASGSSDMYRIADNTQGRVEQLTFSPAIGEYHPLVSKNGDKIVFEAGLVGLDEDPSSLGGEESRHIYLLNTTNKGLVDITSKLTKYAMAGRDFWMDWSPDEKQFVVVNYEGAGYDIKSLLEFVNFDGTGKKDIVIPMAGDVPSLIESARWSPDGKKFVLTRGVIGIEQQMQYPGSAILIYDLKSAKLTQVTDYKDGCIPGEWSPTSQQIVATCYFSIPSVEGVSGPATIRIFDVEKPGQPYERLGFSPCDYPSWSPDGKQIVFECGTGTNQEGLFITNSDGSGIHEVKLGNLGHPASLRDPTWSPDGTQILYVAEDTNRLGNIYAVAPGGSNNHALTHEAAVYQVVSVYPVP